MTKPKLKIAKPAKASPAKAELERAIHAWHTDPAALGLPDLLELAGER